MNMVLIIKKKTILVVVRTRIGIKCK